MACLAIVACGVLYVSTCSAQDTDSPKAVAFAGGGAVETHARSLGEMQAGIGFELSAAKKLIGFGFESGYVGPFSNLKTGSGLLSLNYIPSWKVDKKGRFLPFASAGYTRLYEIGHAVNFGGGLDIRLKNWHAIRFEVRDYYTPGQPVQHNVGFRVGWITYIAD